MAGGIGLKRSESGGSGVGAANIIQQVKSLFSGFNKGLSGDAGMQDGIDGEQKPAFSLDISDEELLNSANIWSKEYAVYVEKITERQENNYKYWKGETYAAGKNDGRGTDNVIFEAIETLLPLACKQNPEPVVTAKKTPEGEFISEVLTDILVAKADDTRLKSKVKTSVRHWALYFIGCVKIGWDESADDWFFQVVNPQRLILDPKGEFEGGEFKGAYIGEHKTAVASDLIKAFPKHEEAITALVNGKLGTSIKYTEWWTDAYVFWTLGQIVLDKRQTPHWNGSVEKEQMDEMGNATTQTVPGINHFTTPKKPYAFVSVFNTGKQPHDETSLLEQAIPLQDIVDKRLKQIDKNADDANNGWVFSNQFTAEQAKTALDAMRRGGAIIAASESISDTVTRFPAPALASYIYNDLIDKRSEIYNIMGVRGSTAQGIISEKTVRGKIEIKGQDADRLALVVEQIEQFVDHLYNLAVQTMYVYYDAEKVARYVDDADAARFINLLKTGKAGRLSVSVKEGSTIPRDALTVRNEAVDLFNSHALDPLTLFEKLQFADPEDTAKRLLTFQSNPAQYLQDVGGQPTQPPPLEGIPPAALTQPI